MRNLQGRNCLACWFLVAMAVALTGCQQIINYPSPTITTISPTSISAGQPTFTLTVTGYNFTPASTVNWNASPLVAIFVNTNTLTAQIPAGLIQNPGTANITVTTPQPGGGTTLALTFVINPVDQSDSANHLHFAEFRDCRHRRRLAHHQGNEFRDAVGSQPGKRRVAD